MEKSGLFHVRFMDDILVLTPSRWKLRRAVDAVNEMLARLGLDKHPDKTFVGRIEKGFDFLGYHFSRTVLTVPHSTRSENALGARSIDCDRLADAAHGDLADVIERADVEECDR